MDGIGFNLDSLNTARKNLKQATDSISNKSKSMPIGEFLGNMDKNKDKKVSTDEFYRGILEDNKEKINGAYALKSMIKTPSKNNLTLEEKALELGMDKSAKDNIRDTIGDNGLDLNNLSGALSKMCGVDFKTIIDMGKKYEILKPDFDITKASLKDIEKLLDDMEKLLKDPKVQKTINLGKSTYSNYKKGNTWDAVKGGVKTYKSLVSTNFSNDLSAKYTEKLTKNFADNQAKKVDDALGNNWFSSGVSSATGFVIKQGADVVTGVTANKAKKTVKSAWKKVKSVGKAVQSWF